MAKDHIFTLTEMKTFEDGTVEFKSFGAYTRACDALHQARMFAERHPFKLPSGCYNYVANNKPEETEKSKTVVTDRADHRSADRSMILCDLESKTEGLSVVCRYIVTEVFIPR